MKSHRLTRPSSVSTSICCVLACLLPLSAARAVSPPPDGGYAGFNTAEGENALFSLTGGINNTAIGFNALFTNDLGTNNTATGYNALLN